MTLNLLCLVVSILATLWMAVCDPLYVHYSSIHVMSHCSNVSNPLYGTIYVVPHYDKINNPLYGYSESFIWLPFI